MMPLADVMNEPGAINSGTSPWPAISAVRVAVSVRWARPTVIPGPVIANVLRGALGLTFRKLVCPREWMDNDCAPCPLFASCGYAQVFAPSPPADAVRLRLQQDLPRPFVIEPPGLDSDEPHAADRLRFGLMLFGSAVDRLPYFVTTLERLGRDGMGRDRVPFELIEVRSQHPAGDELLLREGESTLRLPTRRITTADLIGHDAAVSRSGSEQIRGIGFQPRSGSRETSPASSPRRLTLRFVTPTLLKTGSGIGPNGERLAAREVREKPELGVIVRRLRDRLSSLSAFFGTGWFHPDFAGLGAAADRAVLIESDTKWLSRKRTSTRTGHSYDIEGLVGEATYEFPDEATLATLRPLLAMGELIHIGKNAPWGNGKVVVVDERNADRRNGR
jgi:hypothetical protein